MIKIIYEIIISDTFFQKLPFYIYNFFFNLLNLYLKKLFNTSMKDIIAHEQGFTIDRFYYKNILQMIFYIW